MIRAWTVVQRFYDFPKSVHDSYRDIQLQLHTDITVEIFEHISQTKFEMIFFLSNNNRLVDFGEKNVKTTIVPTLRFVVAPKKIKFKFEKTEENT